MKRCKDRCSQKALDTVYLVGDDRSAIKKQLVKALSQTQGFGDSKAFFDDLFDRLISEFAGQQVTPSQFDDRLTDLTLEIYSKHFPSNRQYFLFNLWMYEHVFFDALITLEKPTFLGRLLAAFKA